MTKASECVPCPTGKYCKDGTIKGDCDDGFFCLAGASNKQPKNEFFEDTILSYSSVCEPGVQCAGYCPPGHFCSLETYADGSSSAGNLLPIPCPQNTYMASRRGRQTSRDQCSICEGGDWCKKGTKEPSLCPEGYFCFENIGPQEKFCIIQKLIINSQMLVKFSFYFKTLLRTVLLTHLMTLLVSRI